MQESDHDEVSADDSQYAGSEYQSSSDGQREGRFYGPDSSWRYYTQDERALAASLQHIENNDLSIALYNVHAMKARARGAEVISIVKPWHCKARWIQADRDGNEPFQPPPKWTAWPLKPETVPRTREVWGVALPHPDVDSETFSKVEVWKPSLNLEEELKAVFLRQAKLNFNQRHWIAGSLSASHSSEVSHSSATSSDREGKRMVTEDEQAESLSGDAHSESGSVSIPLFMADDDLSGSILQPTIRHIISKQDELLATLHQSRRGHRMDHSFSTRAKRKAPSGYGSATHDEKFGKAIRKRKRIVSEVAELPKEQQSVEEINEKPARKARGQYRRTPGQRDWSEVLGIATMAGWDQAVIDRAARRCAAIFGESMSMRCMAETSTHSLQDKTIVYAPDMIPPIETMDVQPEEAIDEYTNSCPHKACRRHHDPYEKRWRLREHLKKKHKYSAIQLKDWASKVTEHDRQNVSKIVPLAAEGSIDEGEEGIDARAESERDDFLQPITVRIGRSRDKRPRASASRSRSQSAAAIRASGDDVSGSTMSTDSEL